MSARVAAFDWARTPLGPRDAWPAELRIAVDICLNSRFPMFVWWGPQLINIYNDAYIPVLGKRHPIALGQPARHMWNEIWDVVGPQADVVMQRGEATWNERVLLVMERKGFREDTYFTWSYSPIRNATGEIGGLFCACTEETVRVRAEARDSLLLALDELIRPLTDPSQITSTCARVLGEHLGADRCAYADVEADQDTFNLTGDYNRGVPSIVGRYHFTNCGEEVLRLMRENKPFVVEDVDTHQPPLGDLSHYRQTMIQSIICAPMHKAGRFVAAMAVHQRTPRKWSADDVDLVRHVAARCWESLERARVERTLRESELHMRALVNASSDVVYWMSPDWTEMRQLDDRGFMADLSGEPRSGWLDACVFPDEQPRVMEAIREAIRTSTVFELEHRVRRVDGTVGWTQFRAVPLHDAHGNVTEWIGAASDVTERKLAEEALRESDARARLLVDTARQLGSSLDPDAIYLRLRETVRGVMPLGGLVISSYDPADGYVRCAHAWVSGQTLDPTTLPPIKFRPDDSSGMQTQVIRTGKPLLFNDVVTRVQDPKTKFYEVNPDGSMRDLRGDHAPPSNVRSAIMVPLFSEGHVVGVVQVMSNTEAAYTPSDLSLLESITLQLSAALENARLYRRVHEAKESAEAASRAKGEFLATLSHELRTPLTPVLLTVSLMESHPSLPDDLRADVATIRRNVELESRLISDLLDLTRIERGKLQLDIQDVDVHLIIRAAADICQRDASAKLTIDLSAVQHVVRGDSTRLQQIFWNLVNNAIKFTPSAGSVAVRSSNVDDGRIRIEVIDTGEGIDPIVLPKLFTAFEQGDARTARKFAGLGLGLAISKKLVEAHDGTIVASSDGRGHGSTFMVELPVIAQLVHAESQPHRPIRADGAGRSLNVLLIEDHEPTLRALERLLRQVGHRVTGVTTVTSANAASNRAGFDLIISDLGLPDGSGLDLMRQLRDRYAGRAIALTGYGMESDIAASREAGFAEHLIKPVDMQQLHAAISRLSC